MTESALYISDELVAGLQPQIPMNLIIIELKGNDI